MDKNESSPPEPLYEITPEAIEILNDPERMKRLMEDYQAKLSATPRATSQGIIKNAMATLTNDNMAILAGMAQRLVQDQNWTEEPDAQQPKRSS
jgi:hypothetical protein